MVSDKARENRLRRMADRQGMRLVRARSRDPRAIDYARFALVDIRTGGLVFGVSPIGRYNATAEDVDAFLTGRTSTLQGLSSTSAPALTDPVEALKVLAAYRAGKATHAEATAALAKLSALVAEERAAITARRKSRTSRQSAVARARKRLVDDDDEGKA